MQYPIYCWYQYLLVKLSVNKWLFETIFYSIYIIFKKKTHGYTNPNTYTYMYPIILSHWLSFKTYEMKHLRHPQASTPWSGSASSKQIRFPRNAGLSVFRWQPMATRGNPQKFAKKSKKKMKYLEISTNYPS